MKKIKLITIILILCLLPLTPCQAATKQIKIKSTTTYKILKGEKLKLYVKGHKRSKKVKWKSSNKKIATVSKKGVVTGKKGGTCKIIAKLGKKKYKAKIFVIKGERTVYDHDVAPDNSVDRYDTSTPETTKEKIQYNEWMSERELEKTGVYFTKIPNSNVLHITGQTENNSISGSCKSYSLTEIPDQPITNIIYGSELRYKWNGTEFLFNTNDMKFLGLIVNDYKK